MKKPAPAPTPPPEIESSDATTLDSATPDYAGIVTCPGLNVHATGAVFFTDSAHAVHAMADPALVTLTAAEAAADPRLSGLGFATESAVRELIRSGRLYPVFRKNTRVLRIFDLALTDFRRRALTTRRAA